MTDESTPTPARTRTAFHRTTAGVFIISLALMVVAGLENGPAPWAPFYVVYVALAIGLPLAWKTYRFGPVRNVPWWMWLGAPVTAILLQAVGSVIVNVIYQRIVIALGGPERMNDPIVSVPAMFDAMYKVAASRLGMSAHAVKVAYLSFIVAWSGLGEELYFRGYVQGTLRERKGARYAIVTATLLFAVRHYMQMGLLLPKYPLFSATAWMAMAIPVGLVLGLFYEKTKSLWIPVVIHYLFNIVPFLLG